MTPPDSSDTPAENQKASSPRFESDNGIPGIDPGGADPAGKRTSRKPGWKNAWNQAAVLVSALAFFSIIDIWSPPMLLWSYVAALMFVNYVVPWLGLQSLFEQLTQRQRWVIGVVLAVPLFASLARSTIESDSLKVVAEVREFTKDKWTLQNLPSIFPDLVRTDQPQRFFIYSPGSETVTARLGHDPEILPSENLGHGLFLLNFDPRQTGTDNWSTSPLEATLTTDGVAHARTMRVIRPTPHPRWFSSSPSAGIAATVSEESDELILVHRDGRFQRIGVDDGPTDCAMFAGGTRVAVCHRYQTSLCIVDVATGKIVARQELARFQVRATASPDETLLAVALDGKQRGIQFLSLPDVRPLDFVPLPFAPDWIAFGRDSNELVVTDRSGRMVHRLRFETQGRDPSQSQWALDEDPIEVARPVVTMCRGPGGSEILFSATSTELNHEPITANHFIEDTIHHLDLENWIVAESHPTHRGGMSQDEPGTTEHGVSPMGLATFGDSMLIAFAGTNEVATTSPETGSTFHFTYIDDEPLGAPHGIADLGNGIWCVSSPVNSTIGIYNADMEIQHLIRLAPDTDELEIDNPELLERIRGEQTFYETTRSGVSCQSCHLHTETDYSRHSIGAEELVGVLTVHGIAGTSPYLRDGSYPRLQGLHAVVDDVYRGYFIDVDWDQAGALENFMASLPPKANWRMLEAHDADQLRDGMDAFVKARCIHCHVPPAMTNLGLHPTKVLFPEYAASLDEESGSRNFLDVPHLLGVSSTPPYLHDGRAPTLEAIFKEHNPSARHGDTSVLDKTEFDALIHFLEQL